MLKALLAAAKRMAALMAAVTLVPVIEAGRLVWRVARNVIAPEPPAAAAEAEVAYQAEAMRAPEAPQVPTFESLSPAEQWGLAAAEHLHPTGSGEIPPATLDRAAIAYLDSLTPQESATLFLHDARHVGEHLLGERRLQHLPVPPTPAEFAEREAQAAAEAAEATRAEMEKTSWIAEALDELIAYEPRVSLG
ncbi:hypothetical protein [Methylobacterium nonmethylotrophicum]|uniref:Uncharacterized protein n=1 Tax=Methylobacterium nonmethylotrophicum TaxID=1141884 RepID=A0A4Z0NGM3_9HYPH|nr:hypothetical protein [Methylobacterium nonmethylotrophicum]TGD95237.1 hypothetical protein EU555_28650 [Methylobacterium nonmethylotrophicum]